MFLRHVWTDHPDVLIVKRMTNQLPRRKTMKSARKMHEQLRELLGEISVEELVKNKKFIKKAESIHHQLIKLGNIERGIR